MNDITNSNRYRLMFKRTDGSQGPDIFADGRDGEGYTMEEAKRRLRLLSECEEDEAALSCDGLSLVNPCRRDEYYIEEINR